MSGGIGLLVRAEVRRRWPALLLVGLLAGGVGAAVTAGVAGARRSDTAFDRLAERSGLPDASVTSFVDGPFLDEVAARPEVAASWRYRTVIGQMLDIPAVAYLAVVAGPPRPDGLLEPLVEQGRLPADDADDEVAVADGLAADLDLEVGDELRLGLLTQDEFEAFDEGFGAPDGTEVAFRVVGTFALAGNDESNLVGVLASPAFAARDLDAGGGDGVMVRLDGGAGAAARFADGVLEASAVVDLPPDAAELGAYDLTLAGEVRERSAASATVVARGLLLAASAGLVVGLLAVSQTVARHHVRSLARRPELRALGLDRRQRVAVSVVPFVVVTVPVAVVATVAGAVALSPLLPIGSARRIEPSPGLEANLVVLGAGALAVALLVPAVAAAVAARDVRRVGRARPPGGSAFTRALRAGVPLPAAFGAGLALDRGRGRSSLPVRAAIAGVAVSVAAVVGAATFGASVGRLVDTPDRFGTPGDALVTDVKPAFLAEARADPEVEAVLVTNSFDLVVEGARRDALSAEVVKGSIGFRYLEGRPPSGPAELALGPGLVDRLGVGVGDTVDVGEGGAAATVVGVVLARADIGTGYADTVLVDEEIRARETEGSAFREATVRYAEGVDVEARAAALAAEAEVELVVPPPRVADIGQIRDLPLVFAGAAALLGVALLGHAVAVTVRRRGPDLALIRALGGRPGETVRSVLAMTAVVVVLAVAVGIPVGILLGNVAWRAVATSLFVADDLTLPVALILAALPVGLVVGVGLAVWPARRAARRAVADQLRRE